ncbi:MAG: hypothetical protein WDW38_006886 [Sanguina aurantia]
MYKDDLDEGIKSWYTGEGGRGVGVRKNEQVRSQTLTKGNKALKCNFDEQVPVRVFRKKSKHDCIYYYEGIYTVAEFKYEPCSISSDIFVYKFHLCAISGESLEIPSVRVVFSLPLVNGKRMFQRQRLGSDRPRDDREDGAVEGTEATCRPAKRVKKSVAAAPKEKGTVTETGKKQKASSPAVRSRPHLLCEDLSYGKETVRIPVFNEVNDSKELPQLEYHADYVWAAGIQEMCCVCAKVMGGVTLPLEVFMTEQMGWGLRCSVDVPIGAFVVSYIGEVTTEHLAEQSDSNHYQYDLNHFVQQHKLLTKLGPERFATEVEALHRIAPMPSTHAMFQTMARAAAAAKASVAPLVALMEAGEGPEFESLLVVDAQRRGNAARFINGRCGGGNLTAQVVFAKGARNSLFHYISFFANAHIKAGVEFSYDYHWNKAQKGADAVRQCFCDGLQPGSTDPADTAKMKALQDMYDGLFKKYKAQGHHKPDQASCKEMYEQMRPSPIPPPSHGHGFPRAALGQKFNGKGELRATGLHTNHGGGISYVSSVVRKKWPG